MNWMCEGVGWGDKDQNTVDTEYPYCRETIGGTLSLPALSHCSHLVSVHLDEWSLDFSKIMQFSTHPGELEALEPGWDPEKPQSAQPYAYWCLADVCLDWGWNGGQSWPRRMRVPYH